MGKIKISMLLFIFVTLFTITNVFAADWYSCRIVSVIPRTNGQIDIKFVPGTNETRFSGQAAGYIHPDDFGAKNMYATVLTAVSMGMDVTFRLGVLPDPTIQNISGIELVVN